MSPSEVSNEILGRERAAVLKTTLRATFLLFG